MLACVCAINTWTLHTCDIPGLAGRTHCQHATLCLCYQRLNTSHLWVPGSAGRTQCDATCCPMSVLSTSERFTPVMYLVQQGEPIATPHADLCLCYQHLNASHLWHTWFSRENPLRRHMPACVCAINTWTLRAGSISSTTSSRFCTATINSDTAGESPVKWWDNHQWFGRTIYSHSGTIISDKVGQSPVTRWDNHQWQGGTITSVKMRQSPVTW